MPKKKTKKVESKDKQFSTLAQDVRSNKFKEIFSKPEKSDEDVRYIYERVKDMVFFSNFIAEQQLTDEEAILDICRSMKLERYFPGEVIFYEDDPSYGKFFVISRGVVYVVQSAAKAANVFEEENVQEKEKTINQKIKESDSSSSSNSLNNSLTLPKTQSLKKKLTVKAPIPVGKGSQIFDELKKNDNETAEYDEPINKPAPPTKVVNARNSVRMNKTPTIIVEPPADPSERNSEKPAKSLFAKSSEPHSAKMDSMTPSLLHVPSSRSEGVTNPEITNPETSVQKPETLVLTSNPSFDSFEEEESRSLVRIEEFMKATKEVSHIEEDRKETDQQTVPRERKASLTSHIQVAKSRIMSMLRWPKKFSLKNEVAPTTIKERVEKYGKLVCRLTKGMSFGEGALRDYHSKRSATIIAASEIELLVLEAHDMKLVRQHVHRDHATKQEFMLQYFPFLDNISATKYIQNFVYLLIQKIFPLDTLICKEGETGDRFFVLFEGNCSVYKTFHVQEDGSKLLRSTQNLRQMIPISIVEKGAFIGEEILFNSESKFEYNVKVTSPTAKFFSINKAAFLKKFPRDTIHLLKNLHEKKRQRNLNTVQAVLATKYNTAKVISSPGKTVKHANTSVAENAERDHKDQNSQKKSFETPQKNVISDQAQAQTSLQNFDKDYALLREPIFVIPKRDTVFQKPSSPLRVKSQYNVITGQDPSTINENPTKNEKLNEYFRVPTALRQLRSTGKKLSSKRAFEKTETNRKWIDLSSDPKMKVDGKKVQEYKETMEHLQDAKTHGKSHKSIAKSNSSSEITSNVKASVAELKALKIKEKETRLKRRTTIKNQKGPACTLFHYYDYAAKVQPELNEKRNSEPTATALENIKYNFGKDDLRMSRHRTMKLKLGSTPQAQLKNTPTSLSRRDKSDDEPRHLLHYLVQAREDSINFRTKQEEKGKGIAQLMSLASTPRASRGNDALSPKSNPFSTFYSATQQFSPSSPCSTRARVKGLVIDNMAEYYQGGQQSFSITASGFQINSADCTPKSNSHLTSPKNFDSVRRTISGGKFLKDERPSHVKNLFETQKLKSITRQRGLLKDVIDRRADSEERESFTGSRTFSRSSLYDN